MLCTEIETLLHCQHWIEQCAQMLKACSRKEGSAGNAIHGKVITLSGYISLKVHHGDKDPREWLRVIRSIVSER